METRADQSVERPTAPVSPATPNPPAARRRLHPAVLRLVAVALLFAGWLGYLTYLVVTLPHTGTGAPLIVSRAQLLISEVDVIAEVNGTGADAEVTVKEVLYPKDKADLVGKKIHVTNLWQCRATPPPGEKPDSVPLDWTGPGLYLLPLLE